MLRMGELAEQPDSTFTHEFVLSFLSRKQTHYSIYQGASRTSDISATSSNDTRADDTKSLKSAILDWITPRGQSLNPPLARNVKMDRGFYHERTGALLCPAGLDWSNAESV